MDGSLLRDAFAHHVWATLRLLDACRDLGPAQLETTTPGTYGSIIDTLRHLVAAGASYLEVVSGEVIALPDSRRPSTTGATTGARSARPSRSSASSLP